MVSKCRVLPLSQNNLRPESRLAEELIGNDAARERLEGSGGEKGWHELTLWACIPDDIKKKSGWQEEGGDSMTLWLILCYGVLIYRLELNQAIKSILKEIYFCLFFSW